MALTASKLRENIYNILDAVLETGIPAEIERNGRTLRIVAEDAPSKLGNLVDRPDAFIGDPSEIARIGWTMNGDWYLKPESAVLSRSETSLQPDGTLQ